MALDNLLTEQEFLQLQKGNAAAFEKVYEAYYSLVQYVIFRCGVDHEEKRDLIQETFLRLHARAGEIRDAGALKSWLVTCARNLAIDYRRKKPHLSMDDAKVEETLAKLADEPTDKAQRELEIKLVGDLIQQVCEKEQDDTFKLFYVDGLKAREIADRRGEAVSTVTTRISRLRQKFQRAFIKHLEDLNGGGGNGRQDE